MAENNLLEDGRLVYAKGHQIGGLSGSMTGIAAGALLYTIRVPAGAEPLVMSQLEVAIWSDAAFTAAQSVAMLLYKLTGYTSLPSGGVNLSATRKRVAEHAPLGAAEIEAKIASASALTGGTFTAIVTAEPIAAFVADITVAAAAGFVQGKSVLTPKNRIPWTLAENEGIMLVNQVAFGAGGAVRLAAIADIHKS